MNKYEDGLASALNRHLYKQDQMDTMKGLHNMANKYIKHCKCFKETMQEIIEVFEMKKLYSIPPESMVKALVVDVMRHGNYRDVYDIVNKVYEHSNCLIEQMVNYKG
jgi:hypothetical protein